MWLPKGKCLGVGPERKDPSLSVFSGFYLTINIGTSLVNVLIPRRKTSGRMGKEDF